MPPAPKEQAEKKKKKSNLPQNVVCCVKKPGLERYGVKMLFETRQIRVGSRFKDTDSASIVAKYFRRVVRITEHGRFFIAEKEALKLRKETTDSVKYYLKFSQEYKTEHVVDFLVGWVDYMKSRPSPKPRKRRRSLSSSTHNEADSKRDDAGKKRRKRVVTGKGIGSSVPDAFLHGADILNSAKDFQGGNKVVYKMNRLHGTMRDTVASQPERMSREHSFGHESPNSVTHSPSDSNWELLTKLIDAEREKHEARLKRMANNSKN